MNRVGSYLMHLSNFSQLYRQLKTHFDPDGPEQAPPKKPGTPSVTKANGTPEEPVENEGAVMMSRLNDVLLISELRSRAEQAEKELAELQQDIVRQVEAARGDASAPYAEQAVEIERRATEQVDTAILQARAAAEQLQAQEQDAAAMRAAHAAEIEELKRTLAASSQPHPDRDEEVAQLRAELEASNTALARQQAEMAERVEQARQDADATSTTQLSEMEAKVSATREAHALAEELFTRNQAELAEQHQKELAGVRAEAERAQAEVKGLQATLSERLEEARRTEAESQTVRVAEVEARAEADLKALRQELSGQAEQTSRQSDAEHRAELEQMRTGAEAARAAERVASEERHSSELARVRAELEKRVEAHQQSEARLGQQLADLESGAEERLKAAMSEAKAEAESKLAEARADWERSRDEAVNAAVASVELSAQRRLETELARVRSAVTRSVGKKFETAYARIEERRRRAVDQAQAAAAQELVRALATSLEGVTHEAEDRQDDHDVVGMRDAATA